MKLPLLAALSALTLWGCSHESSNARADDRASSSATGGSGTQTDPTSTPAGASEERSWDSQEQDRTEELRVRDELEDEGTGGSGDTELNEGLAPEDDVRDDSSAVDDGTGGSGAVDDGTGGSGAVDDNASSDDAAEDNGAKLDATPDEWNKHKGLGSAPVSPSTGTPPTEGSGGASGR